MQKSLEQNRLYYIDNIKVFLTILVILHHLAIVFGGEGGFIISAPFNSILIKLLLTVFLAVNQSYFMGVFFFISAFFSYKSIKRSGRGKFSKNKIKRLIVPAILYFFVFSPIINFIIDLFYRKIAFENIIYMPSFGALWFVFALGCFDLIYALIFKEGEKCECILSKSRVFKLIIFTGVCAWMVRIIYPVGSGILGFQPAHFPQYILAYTLGIRASRGSWLKDFNTEGIMKNFCRFFVCIFMFFVGVGLSVYIIGDIAPAFGGANIVSLLYSIWEQVMFIITLILLFKIFRKYFNGTNKTQRYASRGAYLAYIIHSAVIAMVVMFFSKISMPHILFCIITTILSVLISFVLANELKRFINL